MKFMKPLYWGESIENRNKVMKHLKKKRFFSPVYLIAINQGTDQLDIYSSRQVRHRFYEENPPLIVGIAGDYEEATQIVVKIAEETVAKQGNGNLKEYLLNRNRE